MALTYTTVRHKLPQQPEKFYARACNRHKVTLDDLATMISRNSSASRADVFMVLTSLTDLVPSLLLQNNMVQLGDLGTISLHLNSKGELCEQAVTWRSITRVRVRLRASLLFKKKLDKISLKRIRR